MTNKRLPTVDPAGLIFDKHLSARLQDAALKATFVSSSSIRTITTLTQAAYDALSSKDSATLYVISG